MRPPPPPPSPPSPSLLNACTLMDVLRMKVAATVNGAASAAIVDVEASAPLSAALAAMRKRSVTAIAVYGNRDHWIGAGSTTVCTAAGKLYIGIISILDIILHLAAHSTESYQQVIENTRISSIVGAHSEGQSLWVGNPAESLALSLEPLAKGVHRFLVPLYSHATEPKSVRTLPAQYALLTQSDVCRFFHAHFLLPDPLLTTPALMLLSTSLTLLDLGLAPLASYRAGAPATVAVVQASDPVLPALAAMAAHGVHAVPVVAYEAVGRPTMVATLSTADFRGLLLRLDDDDVDGDVGDGGGAMAVDDGGRRPWLKTLADGLDGVTVGEFLARVGGSTGSVGAAAKSLLVRVSEGPLSPMDVVVEVDGMLERVCFPATRFAEAVRRVVAGRVHRLWIVDERAAVDEGVLVPIGVLSLGDIIRAVFRTNSSS
ncbi:hypothetical protein DFJ73DRAFT_845799 [Zopfochytrium polystomum]|nr:hypothetical protein DFJ73DRAFT_845799 [Zopfochytrium polystomum]